MIKESTQKRESREEIDLLEILKFALHHIKGVIAIILVFVIIGVGVTYTEVPTYRSYATLAVMYDGSVNESSSGKYAFSESIADTFVLFMSENVVLEKVAEKTGYPISRLKRGLNVESDNLILSVSYTDYSAKSAQDVLNEIIYTATAVADSVNENGEPFYKMLYSNLKTFSYASKAVAVSHMFRNTVLGILGGILFAALYLVLCAVRDKAFKSAKEVESLLGIPVFASVPYYVINERDKKNDRK